MIAFSGMVWMVMWACVPGVGVSCHWIDEPMPQIQPVEANGVWFLNPARCIGAGKGLIADQIKSSGNKLVIEYYGCVFVEGDARPGPQHHKARGVDVASKKED